MALSYNYQVEDDCLTVACKGTPESPMEFFDYIKSTIMKAKSSNVPCVLFDETAATLSFNVHDAVLMSDQLDKEGLQHMGIRGAVICKAHDLAAYKYFETSLRSRAFNVMMFDNADRGRSWLLQKNDRVGK